MALLFIDGFDHYDPQALDPFGDPWLARGKADYLSPRPRALPAGAHPPMPCACPQDRAAAM